MINQIDLFQTNGTLLLSRNDVKVSQNTETDASVDFPTVLDAAYHASGDVDFNDLEEIFERAAQTYDISVDLLKAVAKAESDFDPDCVSSSGAMGIMQLMPGTAKELGVTDAFDPEQNIMGGAKYLAENLKIYNGNVSLALAAYNAGRGNVSKYGGIPPFKETQNYVKKVLGYMNENISVPDIAVSTTNTASSDAELVSAVTEKKTDTTMIQNELETAYFLLSSQSAGSYILSSQLNNDQNISI